MRACTEQRRSGLDPAIGFPLSIPSSASPLHPFWPKLTSSIRSLFRAIRSQAFVPLVPLILSDAERSEACLLHSAISRWSKFNRSISSRVVALSPFRIILIRKTRPQRTWNHIDVDSLDLKSPVFTLMQKKRGAGGTSPCNAVFAFEARGREQKYRRGHPYGGILRTTWQAGV